MFGNIWESFPLKLHTNAIGEFLRGEERWKVNMNRHVKVFFDKQFESDFESLGIKSFCRKLIQGYEKKEALLVCNSREIHKK